MSEIEKLYELAGVEYYDRYFSCLKDEDLTCQDNCEICDNAKEVKCYPPFTAEKQIKLIKWLICTAEEASTFEETLSKQVNDLWQSLTEEEKQQVREILE